MISFTRRAGVFTSAALLIAATAATGLSGALAQEQNLQDLTFVAEPVVQPVPQPSAEVPAAPVAAHSLPALVAEMGQHGDLSPALTCLAQAVYFEARGEALTGQLAVAQVVINRAESGRFPRDYCAVVRQPGQFSFVRGGAIPSAPSASPAWVRARAIARIAEQGLWDSGVGESLYFHNSGVRPSWSRRKASVARIDSHLFYE
ncbi:cell wall hydrolase [Alteraurantiacibacter buctensis]|uniref:Cell wall hydrolase n=1 Tax=Alteraurantiacibacter buctensis TaxID=1503981 RepID=A0A844YTZ7_9SPHN|nr:cell wall hydrolase [Alteraurantiacibacter buctensis]MXO70510.1 cell wall hydrolase [Alteraurantiacibacter buctensis]